MTRLDHRGNVLGAASCALCRSCWVYIKMADWREDGALGACIYGGPYSGFKHGYGPGEVLAPFSAELGGAGGARRGRLVRR